MKSRRRKREDKNAEIHNLYKKHVNHAYTQYVREELEKMSVPEKSIKEMTEKINPILPTEYYTSQEQLDEDLRYWKKKLFLDNWIITARVCSLSDFNDKDSIGENIFCMVNQCSDIKIIDPKDFPETSLMKYCGEKILVHELLHCKYNWLTYVGEGSYEQVYFKTKDHALLEEMAKSLIMTKYNLDLNYFGV